MYVKRCSLVVVIQLLQATRAPSANVVPRSSSWQHQSTPRRRLENALTVNNC